MCESGCVGYFIGKLPKRFSNHKSHIKWGVKSCRLTNHFLEKDHKIVREKSQNEFDALLVKHITYQYPIWNAKYKFGTPIPNLEHFESLITLSIILVWC